MVTSIELGGTSVEPVFEKVIESVDVVPTGIVLGTKLAPVTAGSANWAKEAAGNHAAVLASTNIITDRKFAVRTIRP